MYLSCGQSVCLPSVQRWLILGRKHPGRLKQLDSLPRSSAKRSTALKKSLSLRLLVIEHLSNLTHNSLVSTGIVSELPGETLNKLPHSWNLDLKAFWFTTGRKSSVWSCFLPSSCFAQNSPRNWSCTAHSITRNGKPNPCACIVLTLPCDWIKRPDQVGILKQRTFFLACCLLFDWCRVATFPPRAVFMVKM